MQRVLRGVAAADGVALGFAAVLRDRPPRPAAAVHSGPHEAERALQALALVAADLRTWAASARREGRDEEADILETSGLIADDPVLRDQVRELARELPAEVAIGEAIASHALALEALPDEAIATRAEDVREVGRRAVRMLSGSQAYALPPRPTVVFARDVGPADVAEFRLSSGRLLGFAVAGGATTSHAAIMTRALGLPFVIGLGPEVFTVADGDQVCLDGNDGVVVVDPGDAVQLRARATVRRSARLRRSLRALRMEEPTTTDRRPIGLLCNASGFAEVRAGLAAGARGVGLLRTELAFLDAQAWPSESAHVSVLQPMLLPLAGKSVTVRTLDFGHDKTPPFLVGSPSRGLALTLAQPQALLDQLRAILRAGRDTRLRVLFPHVKSLAELAEGSGILREALAQVEWIGAAPEVGAMIETPEAVEQAAEIASAADFLALGTNDLVRYTLESYAEPPSAGAAADPRVLSLVARTIEAAHACGIPVEACGEAAGEVAVVALLVGLGIDELSVTPPRLDLVRWVVRSISAEEAGAMAEAALESGSAEEAVVLARAVISRAESGEELREVRDGLGGVLS